MRIAVIAGGDPGHVFPAAALAQALRRRGHAGLLCTGANWVPGLARAGIPALAIPHPPANQNPDAVRRLRETSRRLAPLIATGLADFKADVVVADVMTPSGGYAAGLLGLPWLQLVPHPLQDPTPHLPPSGSGLAPARGRLGRYRDGLLHRVTAPQWNLGNIERDRDRALLGLAPGGGAPLARLIASLPALEGLRPDWPSDTYLVGPLEWDPADIELAVPPGDSPLLLLSASTVSGSPSNANLAQVTIAGLAGAGVRLAWTVLTPPAGELPSWVRAGPGRQGPLIEQASAVICGAGHGILAKALQRGRPVVTVPGGGEQRENADRVRRAGLGVEILPSRLNPRRLARAVERVLTDPRFAATAAGCRPEAGARSSSDRAVDVLERLISGTMRS